MSNRTSSTPYEPNLLLRTIYRRLFSQITVDPRWVRQVREHAARGTVVYVLRNLNILDFLALDYLTKYYGLPRIHFVADLGLSFLNPHVGGVQGWFHRKPPVEQLRETLRQGRSAVLFLKRPPGVLDAVGGVSHGRGLREGDELLATVLEHQQGEERPILLVPQTFVWSRRPDSRGHGRLDFFLGPREWPTLMRTALQLVENYERLELRAGEALNARELLADMANSKMEPRVRRATYVLLRRLEAERRAIVGPSTKSPERIRAEILRTPRMRKVIEDLGGERSRDRAALTTQAMQMLAELQAIPDHDVALAMAATIEKVIQRIYSGLDVDTKELERLREASKEYTLILLPCHRSHFDYMILSYLFKKHGLCVPMVAAGDNLNFFPAGAILRRCNAFFIRRSFGSDRLYAAVVDAYIRRVLRDGYAIEVYIEGGRSRTGKLLPPQVGLLNMIVEAALEVKSRKIAVVPVSIGYERVAEASSYERELLGGEKRKEDARGLLRTSSMLLNRFGRVNLQFGSVIPLDDFKQKIGLGDGRITPARRRAIVHRIANDTLDEINRITCVTAGALVALVLLSHDRPALTHAEVLRRCEQLLQIPAAQNSRMAATIATATGRFRAHGAEEVLELFQQTGQLLAVAPENGAVDEEGENTERLYHVPTAKRLGLDSTKNAIIHFYVDRSIFAVAFLAGGTGAQDETLLRARYQFLRRLLCHEFRLGATDAFEQRFDETRDELLANGQLRRNEENHLVPADGHDGRLGYDWLELQAGITINFVEGYRAAARSLSILTKGPLSEKDLVKRGLAVGARMLSDGELTRAEGVTSATLANAYRAYLDLGYLRRSEGKLALAESFATDEPLATIEARVVGLLPGGSA